HHCCEIDSAIARYGDPIVGRAANIRIRSCSAEESFRGYAAKVEAITAHQLALNQRHPGTQSGGGGSAYESSGPSPDHHQIVTSSWSWILPLGRVHICHQPLVVGVVVS